MTNSQITKVINTVKNSIELSETDNFYKASLGFHRLSALPKRVRKNLNLSYLTKVSTDISKALDYQVNFLENLTSDEFVNWLKLA